MSNAVESYLEKIAENTGKLPEVAKALVDLGAQPFRGNPVYEAYTLTIRAAEPLTGAGEITLLAGFDLSRVRLLASTSSTGVFIGKSSQLAGVTTLNPNGFGLPQYREVEFFTTDEIYIKYVSEDPFGIAYVSVFVEKSAN